MLSLKRAGNKIFSDERILGGSEFVKHAIADAEEKEKLTLRLRLKIPDPASLAGGICEAEGVAESELCSGNRKRNVVKSRKIFCQLSVKRLGYCGADVARFLGITTSVVNPVLTSSISMGYSYLNIHGPLGHHNA